VRLLWAVGLLFVHSTLAQAETFSLTLPKQEQTISPPTAQEEPVEEALVLEHIDTRCQHAKEKYQALLSGTQGSQLRQTEKADLRRFLEQEITFYCHPSFGLMQRDAPPEDAA
tara:strand:- start:524 stop:862 length:339 start_codon:yes stop_codon:yes gene_type:complete